MQRLFISRQWGQSAVNVRLSFRTKPGVALRSQLHSRAAAAVVEEEEEEEVETKRKKMHNFYQKYIM